MSARSSIPARRPGSAPPPGAPPQPGILGRLLSRTSYARNMQRQTQDLQRQIAEMRSNIKRAYAAAAVNRLTSDWPVTNLSADAEIRTDLKPLRARSRNLAINTDHGRRFMWMVVTNIVGPSGVQLKMKVKDANGLQDTTANAIIQDAWTRWSRRGVCDVTGEMSWLAIQRTAVQTVARDGEILIRKVRGFDNPFGFALQLFEADHLDDTLNYSLQNGNEIRMGVERDQWKRPVAYWMFSQHPGDYLYQVSGQRYARIPAEDMIHLYVKERPSQTRGVPWMHASMTRMKNLNGYEEAEIIAARAAASKMGIIQSPTGDEYPGDDDDGQGNVIQEIEPALVTQLPKGWEWKEFDPTHPAGNFGPFMKATLRSIASGLLVSYTGLTGDLEGVSYSAGRIGVLEERDMWRVFQQWLIEDLITDVFETWLALALLTQAVPLPPVKYGKFNAPRFRARGWTWVDPAKEISANRDAITAGLASRTDILAEQGMDFEETLDELAAEAALAKEKGVNIDPAAVTAAAPAPGDDGDTGGN